MGRDAADEGVVMHGTSRGGAIVAIWRELKIPIVFVGLGESPEDLQPFSAANYAAAVFGIERGDA